MNTRGQKDGTIILENVGLVLILHSNSWHGWTFKRSLATTNSDRLGSNDQTKEANKWVVMSKRIFNVRRTSLQFRVSTATLEARVSSSLSLTIVAFYLAVGVRRLCRGCPKLWALSKGRFSFRTSSAISKWPRTQVTRSEPPGWKTCTCYCPLTRNSLSGRSIRT